MAEENTSLVKFEQRLPNESEHSLTKTDWDEILNVDNVRNHSP